MTEAQIIDLMMNAGQCIGLSQGSFDKKIESIANELRENSEHAIARDVALEFLQALDLIKQVRLEEALQLLHGVVDSYLDSTPSPNVSAFLFSWLGRIQAKLGKLNRAVEYLEIAMARRITHVRLRVQINQMVGVSLRRTGRSGDSMKILVAGLADVESLRDYPMLVGTLISIGNGCTETLDFPKALEYYQQACDVSIAHGRDIDKGFAHVNCLRAALTVADEQLIGTLLEYLYELKPELTYHPVRQLLGSTLQLVEVYRGNYDRALQQLIELEANINSKDRSDDSYGMVLADCLEMYAMYSSSDNQSGVFESIVNKYRVSTFGDYPFFVMMSACFNALLKKNYKQLREVLVLSHGGENELSDKIITHHLQFFWYALGKHERNEVLTFEETEQFLKVFADKGVVQEEFRLFILVAAITPRSKAKDVYAENLLDMASSTSLAGLFVVMAEWTEYTDQIVHKFPQLFSPSAQQARELYFAKIVELVTDCVE